MSQHGEDLLIYEFFKNEPPGFFIEAGAYDGVYASNTLLLESIGWRGLLVEPHPSMAEKCRCNRPHSQVVEVALGPPGSNGNVEFTCADQPGGSAVFSFVESDQEHKQFCKKVGCRLTQITVPCRTLNHVLAPLTDEVAFLSLDVEGMELEVLKGLDFVKYRPQIILVESHDRPRDEEVNAYLKASGYCRMAKRVCNVFYVAEECKSQFLAVLDLFPLWERL